MTVLLFVPVLIVAASVLLVAVFDQRPIDGRRSSDRGRAW